jgi:g-D-glutamyl-meso-diaminopimelate peptidase
MITAGMHGWEWVGTYLIMRELNHLPGYENLTTLLEEYTIVILPLINPDGVRIAQGEREPLVGKYPSAELKSWKGNAWGVDINRNFPHGYQEMSRHLPAQPAPRLYPGRSAGSERETQAVMLALELYKPDLLIDLHSSGNTIYWHYDQVEHLSRDRQIANRVGEFLGYTVSNNLNQAIGAHLKDHVIGTYKKPAMIVEIGSYANRLHIYREFEDLHGRFAEFIPFLCSLIEY